MSKHYAMTIDNKVIEVLLNQDTEPNWGPTPDGKPVIAIECDNIVEHGMIYDPEIGIFTKDISFELIASEPTQLDRIESMISKSQEQIAQEARDAYTLELINSGII